MKPRATRRMAENTKLSVVRRELNPLKLRSANGPEPVTELPKQKTDLLTWMELPKQKLGHVGGLARLKHGTRSIDMQEKDKALVKMQGE